MVLTQQTGTLAPSVGYRRRSLPSNLKITTTGKMAQQRYLNCKLILKYSIIAHQMTCHPRFIRS